MTASGAYWAASAYLATRINSLLQEPSGVGATNTSYLTGGEKKEQRSNLTQVNPQSREFGPWAHMFILNLGVMIMILSS